MAEQEACADLVDKASEEQTTANQIEGESLLLPLLQGLLKAPEPELTPADSGTESGEDHRSGLIAEVQSALEKLSDSLKSDATDITPERRVSLLQLVTKLQAGLANSSQPITERRASTSSSARFQKRKSRQARHTVGVSREELADARRLIEQISLGSVTPSQSDANVHLQKQNSESSVTSSNSSYKNLSGKTTVKNAVAKPFASSNSVSNASSSVQTPTEPIRPSSQASSIGSAEIANGKTINDSDNEDANTMKEAQDQFVENAKKEEHERNSRRFNTESKKLRMKRANTIDIPKPLNFYRDDDDDSESETDQDDIQWKKNPYYALRGPIRVGKSTGKNTLPVFQPKTDSDKKFLAFLNRNNENTSNKSTSWSNNSNTGVWGNRFGNIKNTFERAAKDTPMSVSRTTDDAIATKQTSVFGPKISRQSARNLQQMFEEKRKQTQHQEGVITGSITVKTDADKTYKLVPKPLPMNQFSHAPQSAFKPIPKKVFETSKQDSLVSPSGEIIKSEIKDDENASLYLYSPKPTPNTQNVVSPTSPSKPWATETGSRVLNLAATKFENPAPRKLNHSFLQHQSTPVEKSTAPYLQKSAETKANTVRKLSGQYDSFAANQKPQTYQMNASVVQKQYTPTINKQINKFTPQNYSIRYDQRPNPTYQQQNYSIRYDQPRNQQFQAQNHQQIQPQKQFQPQNQFKQLDQQFQHQNGQYKPHNQPPYQYKQLQQQNQYQPIQNQQFQQQNQPIYTQNPQFQKQHQQFHQQTQQFQPENQQFRPQKQQNQHFQQQTRQFQPEDQQFQPKNQQFQPENQFKQQNQPTHTQNQHFQPQNQHFQPQTQQLQPEDQQFQPQNQQFQPENQFKQQNQPTQTQHFQQFQPEKHQDKNNSVDFEESNQPIVRPTEFYQHVPGKENQLNEAINRHTSTEINRQTSHDQFKTPEDDEFTSTCQFKPKISNETVKEYNAINSKVMSGPVSQQAVTVRQKSPMTRDAHDMEAAMNLRNTLQKVNRLEGDTVQKINKFENAVKSNVTPSSSFKAKSPSNSFKYKSEELKSTLPSSESFKYKPSDCPKPTVSPSSLRSKFEEASRDNARTGVVKPIQQKPKPENRFQIPVINVKSPTSPRSPNQALSKSDSWHQICMANQNIEKPTPRPNAGPVKSKSSHSLAVPKLFEAGMSKSEMTEKRKTMEAFLTGQKTGKTETKIVKRSVNRIKTSEKVSAVSRHVTGNTGLSRSRTLPDIVCPALLDESNVDEAFDELFQSS